MVFFGFLILEYKKYQRRCNQMSDAHQKALQELTTYNAKKKTAPVMDHMKAQYQKIKAEELQKRIQDNDSFSWILG